MKRCAVCLTLFVVVACGAPTEKASEEATPDSLVIAPDVAERLAQFVSTDLTVDLEAVTPEDRAVLVELVGAAHLMDEIFFRQVWVDNPQLWSELESPSGPTLEDARAYYKVNFGPWDRLAEFEPFVGEMPHPDGAGFYPIDMTREEYIEQNQIPIEEYSDPLKSLDDLENLIITYIQKMGIL